ncbi:MAG: hypothetical protein C5B45_03330 [Chlamydiae bacterium]|nr:MAG: hypothetical protein C5B45_03330 [Chlamydiota bacterium]
MTHVKSGVDMKIGPRNPKSNDHRREAQQSSLMKTRNKVSQITKKIPHAFTTGKVHFTLKASDESSKKTSRLFVQKMHAFNKQ